MPPADRTIRVRVLVGLAATGFVLLTGRPGAAAAPPDVAPAPLYRIEQPSAEGVPAAAIALTVGADNQAELTLVRAEPAPEGETLRIVPSLFRSADEGSFTPRVFLHDRETPDAPEGAFKVAAGSTVLALVVSAPDLPPTGAYRGTLTLVSSAAGPPLPPVALTLTRSSTRPAKLIVEGAPTPLVITLGLLGATPEGPLVAVTLRDANGYGPVTGVRASVEEVPEAPDRGFDPGRQLSFWFDRQPVADFLSWSPQAGDARSIPAGGQARLDVGFRDLHAGDTTLTLRVRAANSADDDRQRVTLKLHVRHHLAWALVVLLGAIALSFLSTQVVAGLRRAADIERRTRDLEGGWLRDEPALPAVIWARAALAQARELARRWPLWTGDAPEKLIASARAVLGVIARARAVRSRFDDADRMMRYHAQRAVRHVVIDLGVGPVGADALARARARLAAVARWRTSPAAYWAEVAPSVHELARQVEPAVEQGTAPPFIKRLFEALKQQLQEARRKADQATARSGARTTSLVGVEEAYARLKLAWERRRQPADLARLEACQRESLDVYFRVADELAWRRLKDPSVLRRLAIETPPQGECEMFRPLTFSVGAPDSDDELDELLRGYLFRYGVHFRWTFALHETGGGVRTLTPVSEGPTVVQFAPAAGEMDVSVVLAHGSSQAGTVLALPRRLVVTPSSTFGWVRNIRAVELLYLAAATTVALVSGLSASYLKSPSFGSLQDYFTLFLLGVGADQAKNLVQSIAGGATASPQAAALSGALEPSADEGADEEPATDAAGEAQPDETGGDADAAGAVNEPASKKEKEKN